MKLDNILISKDISIKDAMAVIDRGRFGVALVVDEHKKLLGILTDSDIRRAILNGADIKEKVEQVMNIKPVVVSNINEIKNLDLKGKMESGCMRVPVVDKTGEVKDMVSVLADGKISKNNEKAIKNVLVIGGAGYLGSILCRDLLKKGYSVKVLDNLTKGSSGLIEGCKFIKGDIRNISDIVRAIKDVDAVIHLAGIVGDPACAQDVKNTLEVNYLATKNIVEICKYFQINRFIFASTCSVYGKNGQKKLSESSTLNPISLYAKTKIKCEESILDSIDENFSPVILRMATLYGYSPNMRYDLAVNLMTQKAFKGGRIEVFGGNQWRPWLHLEDAAKAYIACLRIPLESVRGEIFNVLSENLKLIDVGKIIKSVFKNSELVINKNAADERNYNVSFDKIKNILKFKPQKKLADGIKEIKNKLNKV